MKSKIDRFKEENIDNFSHPEPLVDYEMKREAEKLIDRTIKFVLTSKELRDVFIAGDNLKKSLSDYWNDSDVEGEWDRAIIKLKTLGLIDE